MLRPASASWEGHHPEEFVNHVKCAQKAPTMLGELCKRIQHCCATLRRSRNRGNAGSCWLKTFTVFKLCARTPGPTIRKNTQQGVQTDATCNIQQCWEFVAHNVVTKLQLFHRTCAMVSLWILATEVNSVSDS